MSRRFQLFIICFILVFVNMIFQIKHKVGNLKENVLKLEKALEKENNEIHTLRAEYEYLSSPERIEKLALKHLNLNKINSDMIAELESDGGIKIIKVTKSNSLLNLVDARYKSKSKWRYKTELKEIGNNRGEIKVHTISFNR